MGYKYQKDAEKLGAMGRNGDSMMMHVNPLEVQALENMYPGSITINPDTGQPEAFFWLIPALIQGITGAAGTGLAAAGTGIGGAFGTSALGSAVGSTLAAPLTTAASALGTLGGTGGIAGSMGGLSTALGAPQGLTAALGAAPLGSTVPGTTGSLSGTLGVTGATTGKTGLAGLIDTGASKLGELAATQVTGPADLLRGGINMGKEAITGASSTGAETAIKGTVAPPGPPGTPPAKMAGDLSNRLASRAIEANSDLVNSVLDPVKQGLGADPTAALEPAITPTKQGIAAATRGVPKGLADKVTANLGDRAVQGLNVNTATKVPPGVANKVTTGIGEKVSQDLFRPKSFVGGELKPTGGLRPTPTGSDAPLIFDTGKLGFGSQQVAPSAKATSGLGEIGKKGIGWLKDEAVPKVGQFVKDNPMETLMLGYGASMLMGQDDQEVPGWAKRMQSDGTGPGEIWSDDYAMQVLPTFQGMQSPQEWEDQWYVSQFNPYSNPTYMRMAGGGIVNAPRYAGGGYINPRLRRP
jgi:hypothetical protein